MRISFCKFLGGFALKRIELREVSFNPLLWGFLFASSWGSTLRRRAATLRLSILFYEDFFLQDAPDSATSEEPISPFNPLLWGFLFARTLVLSKTRGGWKYSLSILFYEDFFLQGVPRCFQRNRGVYVSVFQSSFMRISFCKGRPRILPRYCLFWWPPFNPLLWGFLFASFWYSRHVGDAGDTDALSILFYEDFFLQGKQDKHH